MNRRNFVSRLLAVVGGMFGLGVVGKQAKAQPEVFATEAQCRALKHIGANYILVPEHEFWFGDESRLYSAGVVFVPTIKGRWYVYCEDPRYKGGAVVYVATRNIRDVFARNGRIYFGSIEA